MYMIVCLTCVEKVHIFPSRQRLAFLDVDSSHQFQGKLIYIDMINLKFDLAWYIYIEEMYFAVQRNQITL